MELIINLEKALNTSRLVKKPVRVHKNDGKDYTRMQWVDPLTGQPVSDSPKQQHSDVERWSTGGEKSTPKNKTKLYPNADLGSIATSAQKKPKSKILSSTKPELYKTPYSTSEGISRPKQFVDNDYSEFSELIKAKDADKYKKEICNETPVYAKFGLDYYNHNLSEDEVAYRCGNVGAFDPQILYEGTPLHKSDLMKDVKEYTKDLNDRTGLKVSAVKHIKSLFGDATKEGLESVFSVGDFRAEIFEMYLEENEMTGYIETKMTMDLYDKQTNKNVGSMTRSVCRDKDGVLRVHNDLLEVDSKHQGAGKVKGLYEKTNQLWRHLSKGHPVHETLLANINVGKYSWALHGYDFATKKELDTVRGKFSDFCKSKGYNEKELLNSCGYNDLSELKHSWQFACLDNGKEYDSYGEDVKKGKAHLGKVFMLGELDHWAGRLISNQDDPSEKMSKLYNKTLKGRKEEVQNG